MFKIDLSRRAVIALKSLSPENRKKVLIKIHLLEITPLDDLIETAQIKYLESSPNNYLMKASPNLIILLSEEGNLVTILDIVPYRRLKEMYG